MSHVKCKKAHIGQADPVMSHCCAEVIHIPVRDNGSSMDTVSSKYSLSSTDSVSNNQAICGGHRPDRGIHKETLKVENQQSENTDGLQVKCAEQHNAVRVEWGNLVHNCVLCYSIKAEIEKLVCFLNSGSLELRTENLEPSTSYHTLGEGSQSTQTVNPGGMDQGGVDTTDTTDTMDIDQSRENRTHTGGKDQGRVDTAHPRGIDQGGVDTAHPRGIDQGAFDTAHPRGIYQGEVKSGCAFFMDIKPDIKTLICPDERGKVKSTGLKEIGNLILTETEAVVGICPVLNIKQEFRGEVCNMEGPGDRGYWHTDDRIPLEVPPVMESMGPVIPSPSPSLLCVEPRGQSSEIPSTERPLTTDKQPSHKAKLPGKTVHVMLCNRGAQCYHNQPQDHLSKGIQTVKGCADLGVQGQQLTDVQTNPTVGQISGKGTATLDGVPNSQLNRNRLTEKSNAEVIGYEVRTHEALTDKDNAHSKGPVSEKGFTSTHTLDKPFEYNVCGKRLTRKVQLKGHHGSYSGEKSSEFVLLGKKSSKKCSRNLHQKQHTGGGKQFGCSVCGKKFFQKGSLSIHHRIHTGEKPFECTICGKRFTRKDRLQNHERAHTGEQRFHCEVCNKKFSSRGHLLRHQRTHTGEKPFECLVCHKKFSQQDNLKIHRRIHTGEKPFECMVCHKKFSDHTSHKRHQWIHTAEKPFECMECHKKFSNKGTLKIHQRIHTGEKPFECMVCGKKFSRRDHVLKHQRTHTGEKAFECIVCNKKFSDQTAQKRHQRVHTGEKPKNCPTCGKQFSRRKHLLEHQRMHMAE